TTFSRIYSRAQGTIREILTREEVPMPEETHHELPSLLEEAQLLTLRLATDSPVIGNTISDLQIRTRTGASVVVIKRGAETITNPSPDVDLRSDDQVLLLGTPPQLREAKSVFLTGATS